VNFIDFDGLHLHSPKGRSPKGLSGAFYFEPFKLLGVPEAVGYGMT
jgi:hypothetical protein